ncbi:MAG: aldehyde ferredoxin oxidoreductase family protein [Deltaproteobacteria bacterium]|nr:aldehyde ferredoxin oxidoreductase family protein [Deltaproteobacteria bacterium]
MLYRLLDINLGSGSYTLEEIPADVVAKFVGGRGLGSYLLYNSTQKGIDPLSPENPMIFTAGLAQGLPTPFSPKLNLNTKSPLTGLYLYTITSGKIGPNVRNAGYLSIRIRGASETPVFLIITEKGVEFRDARHLWGKNTREAQEILTREAGGRKGDAAVIGPAGEKLIPCAGIFNQGEYLRCFGRGGCGSVMGSKNLKGIAIIGQGRPEAGFPEKYEEVRKKLINSVKEASKWAKVRRANGTGGDLDVMSELGLLPTRNWQAGTFDQYARISTATMGWPRKNVACGPYCPAPCAHILKIDKGPYQGTACEGPEYESIYALGSNCGVDRFDAIAAACYRLDEYGIDTMTAGVAIGFAMECFEKGLISEKDTGGISLRFGDDRAMMAMVEQMVRNEDFGKMLVRGTRYASEQIAGSKGFAMHSKGLELGGYECRGSWGQALQFAINSRGGCHHGYGLPARTEVAKGIGMILENKGNEIKNAANRRIISDSLIVCSFSQSKIYNDDVNAEMLSALMGREWTVADLMTAGERIQNMERLFNAREGLTRTDDQLPDRLTREPKADGPSKGKVVPLEELKDDYYRAMGWDLSTGLPGAEKLRELGIKNV